VVDRWPLVRLGLAGVLAAGGVEVVGEAARVGEGLLLARLENVDLIVFGSPVDGLSLTAIRSTKRDDKPPKVMVLLPATSATSADVSTLFAAGADALLAASVGPEELADALVRVGRGERVIGPDLGPDRAEGTGPVRPDGAVGIGLDMAGSSVAAAGAGEGMSSAPAGSLTAKELEVLALLTQGHSNKQIARALYVSDATVKTHLQHIYGKLDVQSRFGALSRAAELGLLK